MTLRLLPSPPPASPRYSLARFSRSEELPLAPRPEGVAVLAVRWPCDGGGRLATGRLEEAEVLWVELRAAAAARFADLLLWFPDGDYRLDPPLPLPAAGCVLELVGRRMPLLAARLQIQARALRAGPERQARYA